MKAFFSITTLLLVCYTIQAQHYEYVYRNTTDSSFNCYLKILPVAGPVKGLVVRDFTRLPDTSRRSPYSFTRYCSEAGLMTLITNTSTLFPELFTSDSTMALLQEIINEVIEAHAIPDVPVFMGGISASGTRALRFAQYCAQGKSAIKIRGVFAVDAPLDLARFYRSALLHQGNFTKGMLEEAQWMIPWFNTLFGGGPDRFHAAYQRASVFTHADPSGGNAPLLKNTDLILFHEPDIDWWIRERGASYYDINSYDLAAFAVQLKRLGNENVTLVTTTKKGFDAHGNRKPHSWSIVDEKYLLHWLLERID